tara:strand:+ start:2999 stop:3235 length:237 start_codon:yes stop_codon:yes gene_type:complete
MNIRHIESSRSSSYNDDIEDECDNASLSKSINLEDSKERIREPSVEESASHQAIKTMEISRSKYEGKALKSKRNSTKM